MSCYIILLSHNVLQHHNVCHNLMLHSNVILSHNVIYYMRPKSCMEDDSLQS